ncbi:MAG: DUF2480 family protein [Cyclobacteriaceae bacterium]|nr:DUF2480 family protein [Cytophagales bacterium]MBX2901455.1 DUF2480 family protein [Cyclobacteriaceae bacterium]
MEDEIVNKVSKSALVTFDLETLYTPGERVLFDVKPLLFQELILREKDFRNFIKDHNWAAYSNKHIAITCTADAIVPTWAYMLLASALQPYAQVIVVGSLQDLETRLFEAALNKIDWQEFTNAKVVVKGCSKREVPIAAYVEVTKRLRQVAQSIMFGEPCSTVPVFKRKTS